MFPQILNIGLPESEYNITSHVVFKEHTGNWENEQSAKKLQK